MSYFGIIQKVLKYIDVNLKSLLGADELASVAGFSTYHFYRVFQWHVGYSVMEYVRLRRLAFAASELSSGRKIIDIAMDYGFETHSGFSKAFKHHYGVPPETYRIRANASKPPLPDILQMNNYSIGGIIMEPKFIAREAITIAGYELKTKNRDGHNFNEIPAFWQAYCSDGRMDKLHGADFVKNHAEYGACFLECPETGKLSYVIGVEVKEGAKIPGEFHIRELPPATYAVFSVPQCADDKFTLNIQGTWQYAYGEWFPSSGYEFAAGCVDFEYYLCDDERNLSCDVFIPIVKKGMA
jgi:AraC family transcriptional regulator